MNSIEINGTTLNIGDEVWLEDGDDARIVAFAGRWVKLDSGKSISRADAADARAAYIEMVGDGDDEGDEGENATRDIIDAKYREVYTRTKSSNGNRSFDKGDELAELLRGFSPEQVIEVAGLESDVWAHLNPGQRSMNARNNIRNQLKKGTMTMAFIRSTATQMRKSMAQ